MRITLLGFTAEFAALQLETIRLLHPDAEVIIVQNMPRRDALPFLPPGMEVRFEQLDALTTKPSPHCLLCLGKPDGKAAVWQTFSDALGLSETDLLTVVHPTAVIASSARIGRGVYVEPGCIVSPFAELDDMVTVNRGSSIGHHTRIGRFSTVNPGCSIGGRITIGERTEIGIGAVAYDMIRIGSGSVIGAGSVVNKDVPDGVVAYGAPCRVIRPRNA